MARGWGWRQERQDDTLAEILALLANFNVSKKQDLTSAQDLIRTRRLGTSRMPGYS